MKVTFNAAQYALALAASALVLAELGHEAPIASIATALPAVLASGATFFLVNHVLAGVGVALIIGELPAHYLLSDLAFQVLTAGFVLALSPVVVASAEASMALVPLALLPVLALYIGPAAPRWTPTARSTTRSRTSRTALLLHERLARALARARAEDAAGAAAWWTSTTSRPSTTRSATLYGRPLSSATSPPACAPRSARDDPARPPRRRRVRRPARRRLRRRARPRGRRAPGRVARAGRSRSTASCSTSAPASASPASPSTAPPPTSCCAAPTSRCTSRRRRSGPSRSTPPARTTTRVDRLMLAAQLRRGIEDGELRARVPAQVPAARRPRRRASRRSRAGSTRRSGAIGPDGFTRSPSRLA